MVSTEVRYQTVQPVRFGLAAWQSIQNAANKISRLNEIRDRCDVLRNRYLMIKHYAVIMLLPNFIIEKLIVPYLKKIDTEIDYLIEVERCLMNKPLFSAWNS